MVYGIVDIEAIGLYDFEVECETSLLSDGVIEIDEVYVYTGFSILEPRPMRKIDISTEHHRAFRAMIVEALLNDDKFIEAAQEAHGYNPPSDYAAHNTLNKRDQGMM